MTKKNKLLLICGILIFCVVLGLTMFFLNNNEVAMYKIVFDSNGGSMVSEQMIKEGGKIQEPVDPVREGYVFLEWTYKGVLFDFNTEIYEDITLVAQWGEMKEDVETFTIKFDSDGGSTVSNQVVEKGSKIEKPDDPTREGYTFKGWLYNDNEFDFDTEVNEDVELVAKWDKVVTHNSSNSNTGNNNSNSNSSNSNSSNNTQKPETSVVKKFTVTFDSKGGSSVASQTVTEGSKATKPSNPTRSGYTFAGWTLNGCSYSFDSKVTKNITLVANWKEVVKNKYTVTFDSKGGSSVASQTVTEGSKATKPSNPTKEGYKFSAWTLNGSNYSFDKAVTGNITLVAKWTQKSYSVVATAADQTSPFSRVLTVYEDGTKITVKTIQYSDGVTLCSGSSPNVNYYAIEGETSLKLVLNGGTVVTATLTIS